MTTKILKNPRISRNVHAAQPTIMPEQPWWNNLSTEFNSLADQLVLDKKTQKIVNATAILDIGARSMAATLLASCTLPTTFNQAQMTKDIAEGELYRKLADGHEVKDVFIDPPYVDVSEKILSKGHSAPKSAICTNLSFQSMFNPINPAVREKYLSNTANFTANAQYWCHDKNHKRPTICLIHGFMVDSYNINSTLMKMQDFFNQGYDILLYTLPHHGPRQSDKSPFSGSAYFSGGLAWLNETILHAIFDFRTLLNYLEQQGTPQFGVTGLSLGGYTTALLACVDKRLAFAIPNVPVTSIADLFMLWNPASKMLKKSLHASGTTLQQMRHTIALHSPLTYQPVIAKERLMIIAGAGDRCAPPNQARLLWDHWQRPDIHWFHGNHTLHLGQKLYIADMKRFFNNIGFVV
ncbi:alpha/beta hydrolase family protein [Colwelliaceae bacterium BS250]